MPRFTKRPVEIEARQYTGTPESMEEIIEWGFQAGINRSLKDPTKLVIPTLEGAMEVSERDWVIQGVEGEFYPCKPGIFNATYDRVLSGWIGD